VGYGGSAELVELTLERSEAAGDRRRLKSHCEGQAEAIS